MNIVVHAAGWGDALVDDIRALLEDTASHLNRLLGTPFDGTVNIVPAPCADPTPCTHYRPSPTGPFQIQLTARDKFWSQYAFQFAHELCHVLSGYERLKDNPNNWFHETICEIASVFTLRRMAERWRTRPPFPNWADYADSLAQYAHDRLSRPEAQLPEGVTLADWMLSNEHNLRKDPYQRDKNSVIAYALLPIFESHPIGWNAVGELPSTTVCLVGYLFDWHEAAEPTDKAFVMHLANALGHTYPS